MSRLSIYGGGVLGAICLWAVTAGAQTPETQPAAEEAAATQPSEAPATPARSLLDLRELTFDLGFEGRYDRRRVISESNGWYRRTYKQTDRVWELQETVGMHTQGALLDERWLLFDAAVQWGLTQGMFSETGGPYDRTERPHGDLLQYDINMTFLPRGTISGDAYASRVDSRIPRAFLPSLDRTLEKYGVDLYVNDRTFPMRFTFEHLWDELTSRTYELSDDEQRGSNRFRYEGTWQISDRQALRLEYEYEDRTERYSGSRTQYDTMRNYVVLDHTLRFGPDGRSSLETLARLQDETGDLARDYGEVSTRLKLQHTDSLSSNFAAQYLHESYDELSTDTWRVEGGVTHKLADALTTTLQLYGLNQHANPNADFLEWGGLVNALFSRENPLGRFSTDVSYNHATTETRSGTRSGVVMGESVTFRDPLPTFLARTDVDPFSVVVTDVNRARTYLPMRDYVVVSVGHYTALQRIPTGQIVDRQTVLVTYTYKVSEDYDIERDRIDVRVQQDFKGGFSPYYAMSLQYEDLDRPHFLTFEGRDINRQRLGATYRQRRWSAGAEYEYNDDSVEPYQAVHFNGDAVLWQNAAHQLDSKGLFSQFWFDDAEDVAAHRAALLDLGLSYRYLLGQSLEATASAMYRYEDDTASGVTNGVDITAALEWKLGYFSLRFEAEYDKLSLPDSGDDNFSLWIKLRRDIPLIARREP